MSKFNSYISSLGLIFVGTLMIIMSWMIPHVTESFSNKMVMFIFLLSTGLMSFHFLRYKFKKMKLQNTFKDGYVVKLVKDIQADNPKTIEKSLVMPFLPIKNMYINDGIKREFIQGIEYDIRTDFIILITKDDDRCVADDLKMREVLSEYTSNGWKVSK